MFLQTISISVALIITCQTGERIIDFDEKVFLINFNQENLSID